MLSSPPSPIRVPLTISTVANAFVKLRRSTSKAEYIDSTSGEPQTHPLLQGEGATSRRKVPLVQCDLFYCRDAVDVPKLLRGSRASLLERAENIGANVLVDERCVEPEFCCVSVAYFLNQLGVFNTCSQGQTARIFQSSGSLCVLCLL
jgi:hypothetical protein